ncbi:MAG: phosphate/phosphite/phosphonate ABC transporter substrate-binding protein [Elusimicrobiota bacterium]
MRFIITFFCGLFFLTSCSRDEKTIGFHSNPVVIGLSYSYFEKLEDRDFKALEDKISSDLSMRVVIKTFRDSIDLIENIGSNEVDFAFLTLNEYLIAREFYGAVPSLQILRNKEDKYYSVIAVKNKEINNIEKLNGKRFASRSQYSISGFVLPSILFSKLGVKPIFVFTDSFENSYKKLIEGDVDAAGFYKNFIKDKKELNAIYEIGPIPNEPLVCRKGLLNKICLKISNEFLALSKDKEYSKILNKMADITGFKEVNVSVYRDLHKTILNYSKGIYSLVPDGIKIRKLHEEYRID